jgi:protoporphyrinogen oxidase
VEKPSVKRVGILGGGIAGLSLGYFLGTDCEILEKDSTCGGLCRSYHADGFTYDLGGHIIFSKDTEILDFELSMLGDKVGQFYRKNSVWFKGRHVKYPFENGLSVLDKEDIFDIVYNFINNTPGPQNNFRDWIYNTFGKGLAEKYLIPYNTKIWNTPPEEMATQWVERIPKPPVEDILKSALGIETEGYVHQLYFYYPKAGGFETLPRAFEDKVQDRIVKNFSVTEVRRTDRGWVVRGTNDEREYEQIVCAMPIFDFVAALKDVPAEVSRAVDYLRYNSLIVVMVGVNKPKLIEQFAVYVPESDLIFHRLCFYGYFGEAYVPNGASSVVAEITAKEGDEVWSMSDKEVAARVVDGLDREGFIDKKDVMLTDVQRTKYAYVIYDLGYDRNTTIIYDYCREQGIELCGRFAEFKYYNSDAVIRSAKTVAARLQA